MPYKDLLLAIAYFVNEPKGLSAIRLSHLIEVSYKTAFVMAHKLREVLTDHQQSITLNGEVEVDGGYFGGYIKPGNHHPSRRGRKRLNRDREKQKCVVITRERFGRSRAMVCSEIEGANRLPEVIADGTIVFTDKFSGSARIASRYKHYRINHSQQYADGWISTNWAESYFSRLRRVEIGTHHRIAGRYTANYANEACWREDRRRESNGSNYDELLRLTTLHPVSRQWKGYWQRRKEAA